MGILLLVCYSLHFALLKQTVYQLVMRPLNIAADILYIYKCTHARGADDAREGGAGGKMHKEEDEMRGIDTSEEKW